MPSAAITQAYRERAAACGEEAPLALDDNMVGRLADRLITDDGEVMQPLRWLHSYPMASVSGIVGSVFVVARSSAGRAPAAAAASSTQRLLQMRVVGQAVVVAAAAVAIGSSQLVDLSLTRHRHRRGMR